MWGNGATFDNVILRSSYKAIGQEAPWKFYDDRCYRTLKSLANIPMVQIDEATPHFALDDARVQAQHVTEQVLAQHGLEGGIVGLPQDARRAKALDGIRAGQARGSQRERARIGRPHGDGRRGDDEDVPGRLCHRYLRGGTDDELAVGDVERDVTHGVEIAIALDQAGEVQLGHQTTRASLT